MPRDPRENEAGGIYHVFARGNNRESIYLDDLDRHLYLRRLQKVTTRLAWGVLAYCLMSNHVHLLIRTPSPNLSEGMQVLHGAYARLFNARHGRVGHVFQGRYGAVRMASDGQVCAAALYVVQNPMNAGLCEQPAAWPWSSFRRTVSAPGSAWLDDARLLEFFGSEREAARRRFEEMARADPEANLKRA